MLNGGIGGCPGNVNSINDYSGSLQMNTGASNGVTTSNIAERDNTSSNWMANHSNHTTNQLNANTSSTGVHWSHSTSPTCVPNMLDSGSFGSGTGHMPTNSSDPFGFVAAHTAHAANDLKPPFYYTSQFGPGIRGLAL